MEDGRWEMGDGRWGPRARCGGLDFSFDGLRILRARKVIDGDRLLVLHWIRVVGTLWKNVKYNVLMGSASSAYT